MPLESKLNEETFFGKLNKKFRKIVLPVALLTSVAASYFPKKAEAQQTIDKNIEVTLDQRVQDKTEDYRRAFGFISDYYFTFQTPGRNYVFARHPQSNNVWYNMFVNGQAIMQPQEVLNSSNVLSFVPLNQDNQPGDERIALFSNGRWQVFSANSFLNYMANQPLANGIEFSSSTISSLFKQQQQPSIVVSYNTDRGTEGFIFSSQGNTINDSNAFFLDSSGNRNNVSSVASTLVNAARRIEPNFTLYNISYVNKGDGGKFVLAGTASEPLENKLLNAYVKHYQTGNPVERARVIVLGIEGKECTTQNGSCSILLPSSFTGTKDVIILADDYASRGFETQFDGRSKTIEDFIVPIQKPGLSVEEEGNDPMTHPWDFTEATARFTGADTSQVLTTGLVHGGHTIAYRNPLPITRDPTGVRYMIIVNDNRITPEMIRLAKQSIIEVSGLAYGVTLTNNDIEITPVFPPLSGSMCIFRWRDLGGGWLGTTGNIVEGNYVRIGSASVDPTIIDPDLRVAVDRHEASRLTGVNVGIYDGDLLRRYNSRVTNFAPEGPTLRSTVSPLDLKVFDFFRIRYLKSGPGNTSTTKEIPGLGNMFILDYSPLNR